MYGRKEGEVPTRTAAGNDEFAGVDFCCGEVRGGEERGADVGDTIDDVGKDLGSAGLGGKAVCGEAVLAAYERWGIRMEIKQCYVALDDETKDGSKRLGIEYRSDGVRSAQLK